jgi:hypothetical protein
VYDVAYYIISLKAVINLEVSALATTIMPTKEAEAEALASTTTITKAAVEALVVAVEDLVVVVTTKAEEEEDSVAVAVAVVVLAEETLPPTKAEEALGSAETIPPTTKAVDSAVETIQVVALEEAAVDLVEATTSTTPVRF